jgi:hypothetical protein
LETVAVARVIPCQPAERNTIYILSGSPSPTSNLHIFYSPSFATAIAMAVPVAAQDRALTATSRRPLETPHPPLPEPDPVAGDPFSRQQETDGGTPPNKALHRLRPFAGRQADLGESATITGCWATARWWKPRRRFHGGLQTGPTALRSWRRVATSLGSQVRQDLTQVHYWGTGAHSLETDSSEYRLKTLNTVGYVSVRE